MSKHTPGPWTVTPLANNMIDIRHSFGDVPGAITHALCRVQARPSWVSEAEANARLIAAAPELLAALGKMVKRIEYYSGLREDARPNIEQWEYTLGSSDMELARAAIAKATGSAA